MLKLSGLIGLKVKKIKKSEISKYCTHCKINSGEKILFPSVFRGHLRYICGECLKKYHL
jgi:hypothetical protein